MDVTAITEFILIFLFAATKFAMALGYMLLPSTNYNYLEIVLTLISGGSFGILVFYFFSNWINQLLNKLFKRKKPKKVFTKGKRRFITVKNKYGLIGISLLTPVILSIPVGSFLASRFFRHNKFTIPIMIAGVVFWAILLPIFKLYY